MAESERTLAGRDHCELGDAHAFPADALLSVPNLLLYGLDDSARRASFAETPAAVDLSALSFLYPAQKVPATRVFTVPYETLNGPPQTLPDPPNALGPSFCAAS